MTPEHIELLILAGKAVGRTGEYIERKFTDDIIACSGIAGNYINGTDILWNPIEDPEDSFKLAVDLNLDILPDSKDSEERCVEVIANDSGPEGCRIWASEKIIDNQLKATMMAITKCAANIAKEWGYE